MKLYIKLDAPFVSVKFPRNGGKYLSMTQQESRNLWPLRCLIDSIQTLALTLNGMLKEASANE